MQKEYDLIVIGSGPAGYVAAIKASQLGIKNILVVEKDKSGGVCLNWGCIPSKALIHYAQIYNSTNDLQNMGIKTDNSGFNYSYVYKQSRKPTEILSKGVQYLLKKNNIEYMQGNFKFVSDYEIVSDTGINLKSKQFIIAAGARPKLFPLIEIDENIILSSTGALALQKLPKNVLIIGSGAIGMEFAYIWNSFGVSVTIIEIAENILPSVDSEITKILQNNFEKKNIKIFVSAKIQNIFKNENSAIVEFTDKNNQNFNETFDKILIATGRVPNTDLIGIEKTSVSLDEKKFIKVDSNYKTSAQNIYAIGDIIDTLQLAHVGSKEGELVAEKLVNIEDNKFINYNFVPVCIYTEPQIAVFGNTLASEFKTVKIPYRSNGKAVAIGKSEGFIKLSYNESSKQILGASIIGVDATEIIHELLVIAQNKIDLKDIVNIIHAHPTISESVLESIHAMLGHTINL